RREVEALVNSVFASLAEALARGERIEIRGFGSFIVKRRNAREGLNPKTGEAVSVAAKRVPFFKAGKELKIRVDQKPIEAPLESRKPAAAPVAGLGEPRGPLVGAAAVVASGSED